LEWHSRGQRFDPAYLHQKLEKRLESEGSGLFLCLKLCALILVEKVRFKRTEKQCYLICSVSAADELKKFKELLYSGIITQEKFDAKTKQLSGL
ncbi:MAG: hypothetical protein J1F63_08535, partial [Oscillospiraceae bacterium]|nr:hypothetical protein [Oscillospiraceae bacterium]